MSRGYLSSNLTPYNELEGAAAKFSIAGRTLRITVVKDKTISTGTISIYDSDQSYIGSVRVTTVNGKYQLTYS